MRITPLDVRKQDFKRSMRGFDADEVRAFLVTLADEYEAVLVDNKQLRERVLEQDEKLAEYRNLERTLRDTLMTAERVTQEARDNARKEGELLVEEARQRVTQTLAEGRQQLEDLRREALALHREKEAFLGRFRSLAEAQIQFVETHRNDFKAFDGRLLEQSDPPTAPQAPRPWTAPQAYGREPGDLSPPPAARLDTLQHRMHDQWRDYAIETAARKTSEEIQRAAAAAGEDPASPAVDRPRTEPDGALQDAPQGETERAEQAWPPANDEPVVEDLPRY
jgi:cell division initiation protein